MSQLKLYTWTTPNGRKPLIMLEELEADYDVIPIRLGQGEQHTPEYRKISPNGKIPGLVDEGAEGGALTISESAQILLYLAEKFGRFFPERGRARHEAMPWVFFQMSHVGPIIGQALWFRSQKEQNDMAIERYVGESKRLLGVLDTRLGEVEFLTGDYGVADMLTYPWVSAPERLGLSHDDFPHLKRWVEQVGSRPAVRRAMTRQLA